MSSPQPHQSQASRSASRKRQRSTRLVVAASLVGLSAAVVIASVVSGSALLVTVSAFAAVVLGAAATRITHSELMTARVEAARDRARQAQEYRELTERRTAENAAFAADMRRKIADREEALSVLENALAKAQKHAAQQTLKLGNEARRAEAAERSVATMARALESAANRNGEGLVRIAELEAEIDVLRSELATLRAARATRSA
jgi:dihydroxyacetone kinase-like predicted kinase